jgi:hypothetical protein
MGIYNAWCDRVPIIVVGGNDLDAAHRPTGVPTFHSAQDGNALVRDFTKWDDTPVSLQHYAQSFVRAYKIAMTPPYGPSVAARADHRNLRAQRLIFATEHVRHPFPATNKGHADLVWSKYWSEASISSIENLIALITVPVPHRRPGRSRRHKSHAGSITIGEYSSSTKPWKDVLRGTMDEVSSSVRLDLPLV